MSMNDRPATDALDLLPDDSTDLAKPPWAIVVGGAGALAVITTSGQTRTFATIRAGVVYPFGFIKRILATGTTVQFITGLYWS